MKMSSFYMYVPKIMIIWCMLPEIWVQPHNFLSFWIIFWPFTPLLAPKIKNLKKIRRNFLFHMCTINKDSWDIRHNRQKFLSFWAIFYPFIPLTNQKIKIEKKWKKTLDIFLFYICLPRMTIIWCTVPEIWSYTGKIFSHFGPSFALIISLHLCTTNDNHMKYGSLDTRCNGQSFLWIIFFPFDPPSLLKNPQNQNFDKMKKKILEILSFVP